MRILCAHCGKPKDLPAGHVNRSRAQGLRLFCNRRCAGLGRRKPRKSKVQRKLEKRLYDMEYRRKNAAILKEKRAAYFKRTYDPVKAARERKKTMARHVEYCRRPEYKRYKSEYDRKRRASEFGPFAEAYMLTVDLNREIKGRMTNEQIKWENRTSNKAQFRDREAPEKRRPSRARHRDRRDRHTAAHR